MEGMIATWYAKITLKDLQRHKLMAAQLVKKIPAAGRVLEIAPGPGYFCIELAKLGRYQITGLDISKSFVEMARQNAAEAGIQADFRQGDAANMPFENQAFDFMFCQAAFKNFAEPVKAIREQIASAVDVLVHIITLPSGGKRIASVCEVGNVDAKTQRIQMAPLFEYHPATKHGPEVFTKTGHVPEFLEKLRLNGIMIDETYFKEKSL